MTCRLIPKSSLGLSRTHGARRTGAREAEPGCEVHTLVLCDKGRIGRVTEYTSHAPRGPPRPAPPEPCSGRALRLVATPRHLSQRLRSARLVSLRGTSEARLAGDGDRRTRRRPVRERHQRSLDRRYSQLERLLRTSTYPTSHHLSQRSPYARPLQGSGAHFIGGFVESFS